MDEISVPTRFVGHKLMQDSLSRSVDKKHEYADVGALVLFEKQCPSDLCSSQYVIGWGLGWFLRHFPKRLNNLHKLKIVNDSNQVSIRAEFYVDLIMRIDSQELQERFMEYVETLRDWPTICDGYSWGDWIETWDSATIIGDVDIDGGHKHVFDFEPEKDCDNGGVKRSLIRLTKVLTEEECYCDPKIIVYPPKFEDTFKKRETIGFGLKWLLDMYEKELFDLYRLEICHFENSLKIEIDYSSRSVPEEPTGYLEILRNAAIRCPFCFSYSRHPMTWDKVELISA